MPLAYDLFGPSEKRLFRALIVMMPKSPLKQKNIYFLTYSNTEKIRIGNVFTGMNILTQYGTDTVYIVR